MSKRRLSPPSADVWSAVGLSRAHILAKFSNTHPMTFRCGLVLFQYRGQDGKPFCKSCLKNWRRAKGIK